MDAQLEADLVRIRDLVSKAQALGIPLAKINRCFDSQVHRFAYDHIHLVHSLIAGAVGANRTS